MVSTFYDLGGLLWRCVIQKGSWEDEDFVVRWLGHDCDKDSAGEVVLAFETTRMRWERFCLWFTSSSHVLWDTSILIFFFM